MIDDGSSDATAQIAQGLPTHEHHRQEPAGLSVARNLGAQLATGSILTYTDDDCIAHPDWLLHLSHAFTEDHVRQSPPGGPNIPPPPRNRIERVVTAARLEHPRMCC